MLDSGGLTGWRRGTRRFGDLKNISALHFVFNLVVIKALVLTALVKILTASGFLVGT